MLAEFAGRNPLVVSFATSDREGRSWTARNVPAIQARTIANRKRTANAPRLVKKRLMEFLSTNAGGDWHVDARATLRFDSARGQSGLTKKRL
jgi:hypothetical protein